MMVKLEKSLVDFLYETNREKIIPLLMFGHVELFAKEIQKEYIDWMEKKSEVE